MNTIGTTFTMQTPLVTNIVREVVQFAKDDKATAVLAPFLLTGWEILPGCSANMKRWNGIHLKICSRSRRADTQRYALRHRQGKESCVDRTLEKKNIPTASSLLRRPCTCTSTEHSPWCGSPTCRLSRGHDTATKALSMLTQEMPPAARPQGRQTPVRGTRCQRTVSGAVRLILRCLR